MTFFARGRVESLARRRWTGEPGSFLELASRAYGAMSDLRNLMYDAGLLAAREAPVPVVSVGGLTVGGSGKTPIAADLAHRLTDAGVPTAVLTHGYADELEVHARLCPGALRYGGRDRGALARRAADEGAAIVVLDSGFQHRRLRRDLDIAVVDEVALELPMRRLPAGPFRETLVSLHRADLIVLVRRHGSEPVGFATERESRSYLDRLTGHTLALPPCVGARIVPGALTPVTPGARDTAPRPRVAVAGIMWPSVFFSQLHERPEGSSIEVEMALPNHARIDDALAGRLLAVAGEQGIVCTLKDVAGLAGRLGDDVPLWYVDESVAWDSEPPAPLSAALALLPGGRS